MAKDSPFDMFHSGAKKKDSSSEKNKSETPKYVPPPPSKPTRNIAVEAMMERMNRMRQEIETKIDEMAYNHGISKETLDKYLSNPKNFTPEQWQFLQFRSQDLKKKILTDMQPPTQAGPDSPTARKGKFVGQRRNWISTR